MMASLQAVEDDLKDVDTKPFSRKLPDVTDTAAAYQCTKENIGHRETLTDETNSHFSCSDDDQKSILQESLSKVSYISAVSDNLNHSGVFPNRMSTKSVADKDNIDGCLYQNAETQNTEYVYLNRLPGENLGMVLGIEGDQENRQVIDAVVVKSVTPIGAVARSCQGSNRILVGDEIREIDGRPLNQLTHDECIALFQDMPDNVVLTIFRKVKGNAIHKEHSTSLPMPQAVKRKGLPTAHPRQKCVYSETNAINQDHDVEEVNQFDRHFTELSHPGGKSLTDVSEYNVPKGFTKVDVTICRRDGDNFGLSIVPSYGATCDLYQIKRLVHSGASAQSGLLEVGDRLLACNDHSLKALTQSQCLNVLKSSGAFIKLTVLRHTGSHESTRSAEGASSSRSPTQLTASYSSDPTDDTVTHEGSNKLSCVKDSGDVTTKRDTVEGRNNLFSVNDTTDITFAQDANERSNQLSYVNNLTDFTIAQDTVERSNQLSYVNDLNDVTIAQDSIEGGNALSHVNDSKSFITIAEDTIERSNKLFYSNDSEDVSVAQIESNDISSLFDSTDFYVKQDTTEASNELTSVNDSPYIAFTQDISEGSNTLSRNITKALTAKGTVNDTQIQKKSLTSFGTLENTGITDNIESIQFRDKHKTTHNKNIVSEEKDSLVYIHIPPPGEFSDRECLEDSELPANQTTTDVLTEDLLFQSSDPEAPSSNSELYDDVLNSKIWDTDNKEHGLTLLHQVSDPRSSVSTLNDSCTVSHDDAFSSRSIEEFADECFSNISDTVIDKLSNYTQKQSSEHVSATLTYDRQHIQEEKEAGATGTFSKPVDQVTILHNTCLNNISSETPLFDVLEYENNNLPECNTKSLLTGCDPRHTLNTYIIDNSLVSKTHDHDVNDEPIVKEETFSPLVNSGHNFTRVSNALENISSAATPSVISLDELYPNLAREKSHLNHSAVTTNVGVTNLSESGEQEEIIAPKEIKYNGGMLPNISSKQAIGEPQDEFGIFNKEHKIEMAEFQSAVTTPTTNPFGLEPDSSRITTKISKEERVSTLHTFEKKENVLDALNSWTSEISSTNSADFHNAVSGTLDSQRKSNEQSLPAKVHTTIGVSNDGQEETVIQPMICAKDHQGWQFCIPSLPSPQKNNVDVNNVPDLHAKLEIVNVISSIVSSQSVTSQSQPNAEQSEDIVREDSIVPTVLSYDQKQIVENVLDAWVNDNEGSSKPSTSFQRAVTGLKISQTHANVDGIFSLSEKSQETGYVKETDGDLRQTINADLQTSTVDKEVSSMLSSTKNIITHKTENVAEKSAKDLHETNGKQLVFMQPEVKERSALNFSDNTSESSTHPTSDHVVLRKTLRQSTNFNAQPDKIEQSTDSSSSFVTRRPRSMIVTSSNTTSRFEDAHKSFTTENKPLHTFRPLSALRPLSSSSATIFHPSSASLQRPASGSFSSSTFASKVSKSEYPKVRQQDGSPFQVDVIQGIVGLGLKVKVTAEGRVQITEITRGGPVDKDGQIHVGDYILSINSTELTGQTDARVQQILRLLPRGLTKLVVSSALPASSESNLKSLARGSNSSLTSTQPDVVHSIPSSNHDSLEVTLSQRKSHSSKAEDTFISPPVNPIIQTAGSLIAVSEDRASEKIELISNSNEKSVPVNVSVDTGSSVSFNREQVATGVQQQDLSHLVKETNVEVNVNLILNKLQDSTEQYTSDIKPIPLQRRRSQDNSTVHSHPSDFEMNGKLLNENIEIQNTDKSSNSEAHPQLVYELNTVSRSSQDTAARPLSLARGDVSQHQEIERAEMKRTERESSVSEENLDSVKIPPLKVPPPVAPKPRLTPASFKGTDDHADGSQPVWPPLRKTFGDDKLHDHKLSKPAVGDNANTFVSSTAKMFDDKTASSHTTVSKPLITRQVSREKAEHQDSGMIINTSLLPTQDRHKSKINNPVSLSQSSTLSRPGTLNYTATVSSNVEEGATKIRENVDQKSNSMLSPTQLNAALSPRKKSSTDSPTSPTFNILKRHAPLLKDEPPDTADSGKIHNIHQSGIYQKTPLALLTNKSPSLVFSKEKSPSPGSKKSEHSATSERQIKPLASPAPSSVPSKEDVMKQFDLLLDDELSSHTLHASQTNESAIFADTQIAEIKKPVALPRRKLEHKPDELKVEIKDDKELCEVKAKEEIDQTQNRLQDTKEGNQQLFVDNSDVVSMPYETNYLSEDIEAFTVTQKTSEFNRESLKNIPSQVAEINETSFTNNSIKDDSTEKFEQLLQLDLETTDADTNLSPLQQYPDLEQVEESKTDFLDTSENLSQQNLVKKVNSEVKTNQGSEAHEIQLDFLEAYANQFVDELMTKIMDNPGILSNTETASTTEISARPVISEEEPPPLPEKEPPVPTSPPHSLQSTDLLINTDDFINQPESHTVNGEVTNCLDMDTWSESMHMDEQYSVTKPVKAGLNTNNESVLMSPQFDINEENMTVIGNFKNPPNFSNSSSYNVDAIDTNLKSPLDLFSEDSGMAGDEDPDVATDDAISPPSESMVIASHEVKKVPFSVNKDPDIVSISSSAQAYDNLMTDSGRNSRVSTDDLLGDLIYDNYDTGVATHDVYHETVHPLLSPTPTSAHITAAQHVSTSHAEDLLHEADKTRKAGDCKAESARPVPTPRSRSLETQHPNSVNHTQWNDFIDAVPQYEEEHKISGKQPVLVEKEQHLNKRPTSSDKERLLLDESPLLSEQVPPLPDEPPHLPDVAPPLPDEAPPLPDKAPPLPDAALLLSGELPPLSDPKSQFQDQTPSLLNQTSPLIYHVQPAQDQSTFVPDHEPTLSEQSEQSSRQKSSLLEQTQTTQDRRELLLPHTEPLSDQNSFSSDLTVSLPDQATNLLDQVNVKETLPILKEMKESLPDKPLQVVQEKIKILAKTENTTDKVEKVTFEENKVNGGQEGNASLEKTLPTAEHVSHVNSKSPVTSSQELAAGIHKVVMIKGATGVGFCIEGGVGSPKGDMPIFIKRIFKGGPAEKCGQLKVRDEILEVNGVKFHSMRHYEAWNHLKFLDDGAIQITIRRPSS